MSNISKNSGTNVGIELTSITVTGESDGRGECWKLNISNQFPIIPPNIENGEVIVDVDSPHKGYSIQTVMENGKMNGESSILNEKNVEVASLVLVDGIANGPCKLYDEEGSIVFEGYLKNGYREGKGKEYDESGNVIFEGFYKQGKRMNIVELKEMKGYWKEMNEKNEVISICQKDEEGNNDGICYFYSNGNIDRISEWKNGVEVSDSGYCRIYDEPNKVFFEGYFENGKREGKGKEYDESGNVIFEGFYEEGKKMNIVPMKEMKGYWKEMNEENEIISICQKDEEGNNDGICYFYSNGNIERISEWKDGEEISDSGYCRIYDEPNHVYFEGYFENGKREGRGKEIDLNGKVVFEGLYRNGKRTNVVVMKEMKGYWKEMNEKNEVISICKKNEESENDGICYFYSNGEIDKVSEWKNGEELNVLKRFERKKMIEFVNGVKRYEGEYRDSIKYNYPREGKGEEYDIDGKSLIYRGYYWNGKRQGQGKSYKDRKKVYDGMWIWGYRLDSATWICIIVMIFLVLISFLSLFYAGIVILVLDVIFWTVLWFYSPSIQSFFYHSINRKGKTLQIKKDLESTKQLNILSLCFLLIILINVLFVIISLSVLITNHINNIALKRCLGYSTGSSLSIDSNNCNDNSIISFNPSANLILKSIEIGNDCYENVNEFSINGLNELSSLKIGMNSFTKNKNDYGSDSSRSFSILNCDKLESIEIGRYSFSDYGGGFELINLPKLSTIKIGEIGSYSYNFCYSSFVIKGIIDVVIDNE